MSSLPVLPNGSKIFIGGLGTSKTMSAVSNAAPAVATLETGHGVATGDVILLGSGWELLNGLIVEAGTVAGDTVPLLGTNAASITRNPPGTGIGNIQEVTSWTEILEATEFSIKSGSQEFRDRQPLSARTKRKLPTVRGAAEGSFKILNDIGAAHFVAISAASDSGDPAPIKVLLPNGGRRYGYAWWSLDEIESMEVNIEMTYMVNLSFVGRLTRY